MNLPLADNKTHKKATKDGNQGLYFNKFFNQWDDGFSKVKAPIRDCDGGKTVWLKEFTTQETANAEHEAKRIKNLALALGGTACEYITTGPFITGMGLSHPVENGFLWHHTLGVPYLPGSSIKGMIRAWAAEWEGADTKDIGRIFGRNDKAAGGAAAGNIIVFDALPTAPVELYVEVITPHTGDWRITDTPQNSPPADWVSPVPIPFLAVKQGAKFQFALAARKGASNSDLKKAYEYLELALEWIGAGAKTAVGFGRFMTEKKIQKQDEQYKKEKIATDKQVAEKLAKQAAIQKQKEEERQANWTPVVGDAVKYQYGQGKHIISKLKKDGDFWVTREDGTDENLSGTDECLLWADG